MQQLGGASRVEDAGQIYRRHAQGSDEKAVNSAFPAYKVPMALVILKRRFLPRKPFYWPFSLYALL
jgi:hypothetical protein